MLSHLLHPQTLKPFFNLHPKPISSLKVPWRRDPALDAAISRDKPYQLILRVLRSVLSSPHQRLPLRYLDKLRPRLGLTLRPKTFLSRHPNLLDLYPDRLSPSSPPIPFLRPSPRLLSFLSLQSSLSSHLLPLSLSKLCKLLMLSRRRSLPSHTLLSLKRPFSLPDDFLTSLVPQHPNLLQLIGDRLHLVSWPHEYAKSAIEIRAEEEEKKTGIRMRPNFRVRLPKGFYLRREMREWGREWMEMPYFSPYGEWGGMGMREMERRDVGVLHEVLSLAVARRMEVAAVGKLREEYGLSNGFAGAFGRHPGIFYVSLRGGVRTAVLREAYGEGGEIVDRDPFLGVWEGFVEMVEEGRREWGEGRRRRREEVLRELEAAAAKGGEMINVFFFDVF